MMHRSMLCNTSARVTAYPKDAQSPSLPYITRAVNGIQELFFHCTTLIKFIAAPLILKDVRSYRHHRTLCHGCLLAVAASAHIRRRGRAGRHPGLANVSPSYSVAVAMVLMDRLSSECRNAILSLATSPLAQCLNVAALAPAISADGSIVPILDDWMTQVCASEPCDQDELNSAASNFSSACAADFEEYNVDAEDIEGIAGLYPLVRELVCLKT